MQSRPLVIWILALLFCVSTFHSTAFAQVPEAINYQGRLVDGTKVVNDTVTMKLSLFKSETGGTSSFEDTNTVVVVDGLYSTYIGEDTASGALKDALSVGAVWLEVEVDGTTLTPREALASAGYSQIAGAVEARGVTSSMLDSNVVTSAKIVDGTITGDDIQFETIGSAYLANNCIYSQKIEDGTILNVDINSNAAIAASKIADGSGSGLDADYLDNLTSSQFLRSDASVNYTGSHVLTIDVGSTLNVNGYLYPEHLSIGYDSADDDDIIYFDRNAESLQWNEDWQRFQFSGDLLIGDSATNYGEALLFDSGSERLFWNDSSNRFQVSADFLIGGSSGVGDDTLFFDGGSQELKWNEFGHFFSLSEDLLIGSTNTAVDKSLSFYGAGSLIWDVSEQRFAFSDNLLIGTPATSDDEFLYFDGGNASLMWDDSEAEFLFTNAIKVTNNLTIGNMPSGFLNTYQLRMGSEYIQVNNLSSHRFYMSTNLEVNGTITKLAGSFRIDHPLDPENKYLYHSFVESPDMKNIYDGVVVLDAAGGAEVELPEWFGALNKDFRYQLTAIGAPGPNLYIAQEVAGNRFGIGGGTEGMKVSWQVTGIRQDTYANEHRIPVEEDKPEPAGEAQ